MKRGLLAFLPFMVITLLPSPEPATSNGNDARISETAWEACVSYGEDYGIAPEFIMAVIESESNGKPDARNGDCKGLMQISERWNKDRIERLGIRNLYDEKQNILAGADLLSELFQKYEDPATVLMVYHGEKNAVQKAERGEISNYAETILDRSAELERMHGK